MGALAPSLLSFVVACAQATQADMVDDGLMQGGTAGDTATAGTGATGGDGSLSGNGGGGGVATAGSASGGGGMASAGSDTGGVSGGGTDAGGTDSGGTDAGGTDSGGMGGTTAGAGGTTAGAGGTTAGMGGSSAGTGGGGTGATGHRYVRFVAKSEQRSGKVWSSCAELGLLTTGGASIPRTGWSITADSQETVDEQTPASNAIDGDPNTFWHTAWAPPPNDVNDAPLPHQLVIDLGSAKVITGFTYVPRQVGENGRIKDWEIYLSNTNGNWGTAVDSGSFPSGTATQTITF